MKSKLFSEEESLALQTLLLLPAGYYIDLVGTLYIRALEDSTFAVGENDISIDEIIWEEVFISCKEAVEFYLNKRNEMKLGSDLEVIYG